MRKVVLVSGGSRGIGAACVRRFADALPAQTATMSAKALLRALPADNAMLLWLSAGDVATHDLRTVYESHVEGIPIFNLISVLEGRLVNEFSNIADAVSGNVVVATASDENGGTHTLTAIYIDGEWTLRVD